MQMFVPRNSSDHRQPYTQPVTEQRYQPLSVIPTRRFRPTGQFSFHDRRFWELVDSSTLLPSSSFGDCRDRSGPHTAACYFFNVRAVCVVRWVSHLNQATHHAEARVAGTLSSCPHHALPAPLLLAGKDFGLAIHVDRVALVSHALQAGVDLTQEALDIPQVYFLPGLPKENADSL